MGLDMELKPHASIPKAEKPVLVSRTQILCFDRILTDRLADIFYWVCWVTAWQSTTNREERFCERLLVAVYLFLMAWVALMKQKIEMGNHYSCKIGCPIYMNTLCKRNSVYVIVMLVIKADQYCSQIIFFISIIIRTRSRGQMHIAQQLLSIPLSYQITLLVSPEDSYHLSTFHWTPIIRIIID